MAISRSTPYSKIRLTLVRPSEARLEMLTEVFHRRQVALQHAGDLLLHHLRGHARIVDGDADHRKLDFRQQVDRQAFDEEQAQHQHH
jgi:hypothetical protein